MKPYKDFTDEELDQAEANSRTENPAFGICYALGIMFLAVLIAVSLAIVFSLVHAGKAGVTI